MRKKGDAHFFDVPYFWVDSPYRVLEKNREVIFFLPYNVEKKLTRRLFRKLIQSADVTWETPYAPQYEGEPPAHY